LHSEENSGEITDFASKYEAPKFSTCLRRLDLYSWNNDRTDADFKLLLDETVTACIGVFTVA
jgi:hypothetical protein